MKDFNCLLIHTPRLFKKDGNIASDINYCAMGLFPLAGELIKEGFETKILHLGVEKYLDKNFSIVEYIKKNNIKFIAFSLHWHHSAYDTIETSRIIKNECPDVFITLGGYTASFFAEEILQKFRHIDAIIKGEGEIPMKILAKSVYEKTALNDVPNIYWRNGEEIIFNGTSYIASDDDLNNFEFFNPDRMLHYEEYSKLPFILEYSKTDQLNNPVTEQGICLGRGCLGNCAWCGGGFLSTKIISGRQTVAYRKAENVISEIKMLKEKYNFECFRLSFDPNPTDRSYFIDLFNKIAQEFNGELNVIYNIDGLPDKTYLDAFRKAFSKSSVLSLSPVFHNEELRKFYKSFFYTNEKLEEILEYMDKLEINSEIFFSEMPGVDKSENENSKKYGKYLKEKYKYIKDIYNYPITVEPASPWTYNTEKYNLKYTPKTFTDYYNETKGIFKSFESHQF